MARKACRNGPSCWLEYWLEQRFVVVGPNWSHERVIYVLNFGWSHARVLSSVESSAHRLIEDTVMNPFFSLKKRVILIHELDIQSLQFWQIKLSKLWSLLVLSVDFSQPLSAFFRAVGHIQCSQPVTTRFIRFVPLGVSMGRVDARGFTHWSLDILAPVCLKMLGRWRRTVNWIGEQCARQLLVGISWRMLIHDRCL